MVSVCVVVVVVVQVPRKTSRPPHQRHRDSVCQLNLKPDEVQLTCVSAAVVLQKKEKKCVIQGETVFEEVVTGSFWPMECCVTGECCVAAHFPRSSI